VRKVSQIGKSTFNLTVGSSVSSVVVDSRGHVNTSIYLKSIFISLELDVYTVQLSFSLFFNFYFYKHLAITFFLIDDGMLVGKNVWVRMINFQV